MKRTSEAAFEAAIESSLLERGGYTSLAREGYDRARAVFPTEALGFIRETQPKEWTRLESLHGEKTEGLVLEALCKALAMAGALAVLRHGFKCQGRLLRVAVFRPAHGLNPTLEARYAANRLGLTRQLHYSTQNENSLDVVLSLNGLPVVTLELKNALTGQRRADAIRQYVRDRDPRELLFAFGRRALVHFAVDTDEVSMTTKLAGAETHFLPFNQGNGEGAGNPPDPAGRDYRTAYLWEEVLERHSLLELLARFMHLQVKKPVANAPHVDKQVTSETLIFPRYHQLDAVRRMVAAAAHEGVGHNYLIEHSAGSGKSNTIAWLAHRLASLHNAQDEKVFDSVLVVTDRVVLDRQLQDTIFQFDHKQGVVEKIDADSAQLAAALERKVPIIITTLQKFPFVEEQLRKLGKERGNEKGAHSDRCVSAGGDRCVSVGGTLPTRRYAVIVDEAHSSQSGATAAELKGVLGGADQRKAARVRAEEDSAIGAMAADNVGVVGASVVAETGEDDEGAATEHLYRAMLRRGRQPNISFFAFTATPKHKTLALFGRGEPRPEPFHRYRMRQAIEEGFIMDVLAHYTTYEVYFRLLNRSAEDPHVVRKKAARALTQFARLHPHNIAQKTQIMVDHFEKSTRHKIGAQAKAMLVTGSRLEAVRYKQEFDRYIRQRGYSIKTLVAFSGKVEDDQVPGKSYTEPEMNGGLAEKDLPDAFAQGGACILLVAEKYQTGFDQPLLHTMYVDKRLAGIQAVQTLSRLNRTHRLKTDTFVLDFVNKREDIQRAFADYYTGAVMGEPVDPDRLYALKDELDRVGIYLQEEVEAFAQVFFAPKRRQSEGDHRKMNALIDRAVQRYERMSGGTGLPSDVERGEAEKTAELWRGKVGAFVNLYAFLSQIIPYQDSDLEKLYTYLRYLALKLPKRASGPSYQFDEEIALHYYRVEKIGEGRIPLSDTEPKPLSGPSEVGSGIVRETAVSLARLIDLLNERFGSDLTEADQLFFESIIEDAKRDETLAQQAAANPLERFQLESSKVNEALLLQRMELNEALVSEYLSNEQKRKVIDSWISRAVYTWHEQQRKAG